MDLREVCMIRTRLRQVNVEFSALLRAGSGEGRFVRMNELKAERKALMALMAQGSTSWRRQPITRQQSPSSALQQGTEGATG